MPNIDDLFHIADEAGIRLEVVDGLAVWEALPNLTHQEAVDRIRQTLKTRGPAGGSDGGCACLHYADLHIKFPDGSDKRADVSIYCRRPAETESAVTEVPQAVIEVLSKGYEKKDLELAPPFYLKHGVKDIVVYDPYSRATRHITATGERDYLDPVTLEFQCGCQVSL
jgi:Uma2 family endonuclease